MAKYGNAQIARRSVKLQNATNATVVNLETRVVLSRLKVISTADLECVAQVLGLSFD